jgi:kynurenine formamidase
MKLIDLSREIYHKMPRLPNHPMIIISSFTTHEEKRIADGYSFSSAVFSLNMGDHSGTHVDAPVHFDDTPGAKGIDEIPLENFFTEAVCLDLSHKPLKSDISIADLEAAEKAAGIEIRPKDTVLLHMDFYRRGRGWEKRASRCSGSKPRALDVRDAIISRCIMYAAIWASLTWKA